MIGRNYYQLYAVETTIGLGKAVALGSVEPVIWSETKPLSWPSRARSSRVLLEGTQSKLIFLPAHQVHSARLAKMGNACSQQRTGIPVS